MADILDDLLTLARTEDTGERWKGDIAMRAHNEIERLRAALLPFAQYAELNDLRQRRQDDAIEVRVRDLLAAELALNIHKHGSEQES